MGRSEARPVDSCLTQAPIHAPNVVASPDHAATRAWRHEIGPCREEARSRHAPGMAEVPGRGAGVRGHAPPGSTAGPGPRHAPPAAAVAREHRSRPGRVAGRRGPDRPPSTPVDRRRAVIAPPAIVQAPPWHDMVPSEGRRGRAPRQPGQVRKEAAVTGSRSGRLSAFHLQGVTPGPAGHRLTGSRRTDVLHPVRSRRDAGCGPARDSAAGAAGTRGARPFRRCLRPTGQRARRAA